MSVRNSLRSAQPPNRTTAPAHATAWGRVGHTLITPCTKEAEAREPREVTRACSTRTAACTRPCPVNGALGRICSDKHAMAVTAFDHRNLLTVALGACQPFITRLRERQPGHVDHGTRLLAQRVECRRLPCTPPQAVACHRPCGRTTRPIRSVVRR